jgi:hypothetical protein
MSRLTDFYSGRAPDTEGRWIQDIWDWSDDDLEVVHDYIQWLFPLKEPSQFNADAPLLTDDDIAEFQRDLVLRGNLYTSFNRILAFLGLQMTVIKVTEAPNFWKREKDVWSYPNHNWLRVTRILRSLSLLGFADQALALFRWLDATYSSRRYPITAETFAYWADAVGSAPEK